MSQPRLELFVSGATSGTTVGQIDLYGDEPLTVTYSINDIKDISKRNSSFTQTFTIPATKNNNVLFNHIFNIGSDSQFDPRKKTPSFILVDNIMVLEGNLQLTKIKVKDKNPVSYDIVIYGQTVDLAQTLGDKFLTDIDWTALNHIYSVDNIMNSWTANTSNIGYYYPLIDYGYSLDLNELNSGILTGTSYTAYTSSGTGLNPTIFKPAVSVKYVFEQILYKAGFSYESDFINSEVFDQLIIPFNGKDDFILSEDYINSISFRAKLTANVTPSSSNGITRFNNDSLNGAFDNGNLYNTSTWKFTANATTSYKFGVDADLSYVGSTAGGSSQESVTFYFFRSSVSGMPVAPYNSCFHVYTAWIPNTMARKLVSYVCPPLTNTSSASNNYFYPAVQGESFWCYIAPYGGPNKYPTLNKEGSSFYNIPLNNLCVNGVLPFNAYIPQKVKQIEFMKSCITLFNLMVVPSKDNLKKLKFIPRNDFYASGVKKDWTQKLDTTEPVNSTLISEQQSKQIFLSYKPDKDFYNTDYTSDTFKVYGEYIQTIDNEWLDATSQQKIEVIFSPTPSDNVINSQEIIIPKIGKVDNNGNWGRTDSNIRILRKNPQLMPTSGETITMLNHPPIYGYPYAGMLDDPFLSSVSYTFGTPEYAYYSTPGYGNLQVITPNSLVEVYWKDYLQQISDKNSKLITCKVYLTPNDIAQLEYNDIIYLEGLTDDGGNDFYINKITYIPTSNLPSVVELIKKI